MHQVRAVLASELQDYKRKHLYKIQKHKAFLGPQNCHIFFGEIMIYRIIALETSSDEFIVTLTNFDQLSCIFDPDINPYTFLAFDNRMLLHLMMHLPNHRLKRTQQWMQQACHRVLWC